MPSCALCRAQVATLLRRFWRSTSPLQFSLLQWLRVSEAMGALTCGTRQTHVQCTQLAPPHSHATHADSRPPSSHQNNYRTHLPFPAAAEPAEYGSIPYAGEGLW